MDRFRRTANHSFASLGKRVIAGLLCCGVTQVNEAAFLAADELLQNAMTNAEFPYFVQIETGEYLNDRTALHDCLVRVQSELKVERNLLATSNNPSDYSPDSKIGKLSAAVLKIMLLPDYRLRLHDCPSNYGLPVRCAAVNLYLCLRFKQTFFWPAEHILSLDEFTAEWHQLDSCEQEIWLGNFTPVVESVLNDFKERSPNAVFRAQRPTKQQPTNASRLITDAATWLEIPSSSYGPASDAQKDFIQYLIDQKGRCKPEELSIGAGFDYEVPRDGCRKMAKRINKRLAKTHASWQVSPSDRTDVAIVPAKSPVPDPSPNRP